MVRWCWVNFQCRGVLLSWIIVGQGPIALAVGAGGGLFGHFFLSSIGGGRVERRCWVNFQCRGVLLVWMIVGQGPIALAKGVGGGCLDIFSLMYLFSFPSPSLWETARYRLKYCLKGPLNPKQPTNQLSSIISHFLLPVFGNGPIARAVGADGVVWTFFYSRLSFLFAFSLSLGDGPIWTEILSQRDVKPTTTNQPTVCCVQFHGILAAPSPPFRDDTNVSRGQSPHALTQLFFVPVIP